MTKAIAVVGFDYVGVNKDTKQKLICLAGDVRRSTKNHIEHALDMGKAVYAAHDLLASAGCASKFGAWVASECGFSKRTAYNYLNAYVRFDGNRASLAQFTTEAVYFLASDDVPEEAVNEALRLAGKGSRINREAAQEIASQYEPEESEPADDEESDVIDVEPVEISEPAADEPPPDPPKISGGATFDVAEIEAVKAAEEVDLAAKQSPYDDILNHLTQAKKLWNQIVGDERDGVYAASKRQRVLSLLDDLYAPVAQCRPMKQCTFCDGKGCKKCSNCGWWPRSVVEGMSR
jgi:hypothetical protein